MSDTISERASLRRAFQLTLPTGVREALHVKEGDELVFDITDAGTVILRGMSMIPSDQRWFWTEEWQAGEREASADIAAGRTTMSETPADFISGLDAMDEDR